MNRIADSAAAKQAQPTLRRALTGTAIAGALAACEALEYGNNMSVYTLQNLHAQLEIN